MKTLNKQISGATLAMAVASLVGCASSGSSSSQAVASMAKAGTTDLAHCYGVNTCKGHNDCKTAANACAGHASCEGTGFVAIPTKACADVGGKVRDDWRGEISTAELSHCHGVNLCKGHNDCSTASNSCKGQGSCKGTGFVAIQADACEDIGGKVKS